MQTTTTTTINQVALDPNSIPEIVIYDFDLNNIFIDHYIDSPIYKTVDAYTRQYGPIRLWEGDAYDAIGQWTDEDVTTRLLELFPASV